MEKDGDNPGGAIMDISSNLAACFAPIAENGLPGAERARLHHSDVRILLRQLLEREFGAAAAKAPLEKMPGGRPYLAGFPEIFVSLSHCSGLAACCAGTRPVGVDVERIRPFPARVARRILTEEEHGSFLALGGDAEAFFRFWTLKESYVKAIGMGLAFSLRAAAFSFEEDGGIRCSRPGWRFEQFRCGTDHLAALCVREDPPSV